MANNPSRGRKRPSGSSSQTPRELPETTPPEYGGMDHSFVLQATYEIRGAIGELKEAVNGLKAEVTDQRGSIRWIRNMIWFATGAIVVGGVIIGFIFERGIDKLIEILKAVPKG